MIARAFHAAAVSVLARRGEPTNHAHVGRILGESRGMYHAAVTRGAMISEARLQRWLSRWQDAGYTALYVVVEAGAARVYVHGTPFFWGGIVTEPPTPTGGK